MPNNQNRQRFELSDNLGINDTADDNAQNQEAFTSPEFNKQWRQAIQKNYSRSGDAAKPYASADDATTMDKPAKAESKDEEIPRASDTKQIQKAGRNKPLSDEELIAGYRKSLKEHKEQDFLKSLRAEEIERFVTRFVPAEAATLYNVPGYHINVLIRSVLDMQSDLDTQRAWQKALQRTLSEQKQSLLNSILSSSKHLMTVEERADRVRSARNRYRELEKDAELLGMVKKVNDLGFTIKQPYGQLVNRAIPLRIYNNYGQAIDAETMQRQLRQNREIEIVRAHVQSKPNGEPRTEFSQAQRTAAAEAALRAPTFAPDLVEVNKFFEFSFPSSVAVDLPNGAVQLRRVRIPSTEGKPVDMTDVEFYIVKDGKEFFATETELTGIRKAFAPLFELANDKIRQGKLNSADLGGALHGYAAATSRSGSAESSPTNSATVEPRPIEFSPLRGDIGSPRLSIMVRGKNGGYSQIDIDNLSDLDKQRIIEDRFKLLTDLVETQLRDASGLQQTEDRRLLERLAQEMKVARTIEDQLAVLGKFERNMTAPQESGRVQDRHRVEKNTTVRRTESRGGIGRVMEEYRGATGLAISGLTLYMLLRPGDVQQSTNLKLPK